MRVSGPWSRPGWLHSNAATISIRQLAKPPRRRLPNFLTSESAVLSEQRKSVNTALLSFRRQSNADKLALVQRPTLPSSRSNNEIVARGEVEILEAAKRIR